MGSVFLTPSLPIENGRGVLFVVHAEIGSFDGAGGVARLGRIFSLVIGEPVKKPGFFGEAGLRRWHQMTGG